MERKNRATTKVMLRALVCGYLLYLAYQLAFKGGEDPTFPQAARIIAALFFAAAAIAVGIYSWKRYRADCKEAEEIAAKPAEDAESPEPDGSGEEGL